MVKEINNGRKLFYVQSGNWEGVLEGPSPKEVASMVLEEALSELGKNLTLSHSIMVIDLSSLYSEGEAGEVSIHSSSEILANTGRHQSANIIQGTRKI